MTNESAQTDFIRESMTEFVDIPDVQDLEVWKARYELWTGNKLKLRVLILVLVLVEVEMSENLGWWAEVKKPHCH